WRLWVEHGGREDYVEGAPLTPAVTSNPTHVFEIHPVTRVGDIQTLGSFRPIEGFTPHDATQAFMRFEGLPCRILAQETRTTILTSVGGYNYVEFILEVVETGMKVEDGLLIMADVHDLKGELLVKQCRMVFVKDTPPEHKVKELPKGSR